MKRKAVIFTKQNVAEFCEIDIPFVGDNDVLVRTDYSAISAGTEKANLCGMPNTYGDFPRALGYSSAGTVVEVGKAVSKCRIGDRVIVYHGIHSDYNVRHENDIIPIPYDEVSTLHASFVLLASMGLGGLRKTRLEMGESGMVFGMGILGIFALSFMKLSGVVPAIAVDLSESRRKLALSCGADYALDPLDKDFVAKVKEATDNKGVSAIVEVTGSSAAMKNALDCASFKGRISLLGCTRVSDVPVDYYSQVHKPGIELIGAHNFVRPKVDSYPYHWTNYDDCNAIMKMMKYGMIDFSKIVTDTVSPYDAPSVYKRMLNDRDFPVGIAFDWRNM